MNVTMKELTAFGFKAIDANRIMNEICRLAPYQIISRFEEVCIKGHKTTQYQSLRSVSVEEVIKVCQHKIEHPRARTPIDKWQQIRQVMEELLS